MNQRRLSVVSLVSLSLSTLLVGCSVSATGESDEHVGEAHQAASPTCLTIQASGSGAEADDAVLNPVSPDKNYGTSGSLSVGQAVGGTPRQSLLKFNLSSVPAGAPIISATATLTTLLEFDAQAPTEAHRVTAPWSESSVTWNSFNGAYSSAVEGTFAPGATTSADLTSLVASWQGGTVPNHGIFLDRDHTGGTTFASSEAPAAQRPKLDVCYCPVGTSGPTCDVTVAQTTLCTGQYGTQTYVNPNAVRGTWQFNPGATYLTIPQPGYPCKAFLYDLSIRPGLNDPNWTTAPNGQFIGFSEASTIPGGQNYTKVQYRYFRSLVWLPAGYPVSSFQVVASGVDDGLFVVLHNSANPNGVSKASWGTADPSVGACVGNGGINWNLTADVVPGEVNVVYLVHADMNPSVSSLNNVNILVNGASLPLFDCTGATP